MSRDATRSFLQPIVLASSGLLATTDSCRVAVALMIKNRVTTGLRDNMAADLTRLDQESGAASAVRGKD